MGKYEKLLLEILGGKHLLPPKISFLYENKPIREKTLMLWGVDGKKDRSSLSNFALLLSYEEAGDVVIPISNDVPDIAKARLSTRFWLEHLDARSKVHQTPTTK